MSSVLGSIENAVSGVGNAVSGVVNGVVNSVANTIQSAINDPIGTAAKIASTIYAPEFLPAISAADTIANGGSLCSAIKSAATGYVGGQVSGMAGSAASDAGASPLLQSAAGTGASAAFGTAVNGGSLANNVLGAELNSGLNGGLSSAYNSITGSSSGSPLSLNIPFGSISNQSINPYQPKNTGQALTNPLNGMLGGSQFLSAYSGSPQSECTTNGAMPSIGDVQNFGQSTPAKTYASGGSATSCTCFSPSKSLFVAPQQEFVGNLMLNHAHQMDQNTPLKEISNQISPYGNMGGYAKGGLPSKYRSAAPAGHNPEFITGITGHYACGRGTGQSDDIPAMLHDGDYVLDADVVSALGDGSSKAGSKVLDHFRSSIPSKSHSTGDPIAAKIADGEYVLDAQKVSAIGNGCQKRGAAILDHMRKEIRKQKRAASTGKIPPKAKSPLDYIRTFKG